jgi:hypothetical protein
MKVECSHVVFCGGMQPSAFNKYMGNNEAAKAVGLTQRFLPVWIGSHDRTPEGNIAVRQALPGQLQAIADSVKSMPPDVPRADAEAVAKVGGHWIVNNINTSFHQ